VNITISIITHKLY